MVKRKKFAKCIFHMGADKTGSTSIQEFFDRHRDVLLNEGTVAYPPGHWHAQFGSCFADEPVKYVWNLEQGRNDEARIKESDSQYLDSLVNWLEKAPACDELLLSYEGFIGLSTEALERLKLFLARYADQVIAVIYIRPPLSYAISAMSQRVKMGRQAWDDSNIPFFSCKHYLETIRKAFGAKNMVVRAFDRPQLQQGDVVADVIVSNCIRAKEVLAHYKAEKVQNESLSDMGIRVGERLIAYLKEQDIQLPPAIFNLKFGNKLAQIDGRKQKLLKDQIDAITLRQSAVEKYLGDSFGLFFSENSQQYLGEVKSASAGQSAIEDLHFQYLVQAVQDELVVHCTGGSYSVANTSIKTSAGETISLNVRLSNRACKDWISTSKNPINLSYHVYNKAGALLLFDGIRTPMVPAMVPRAREIGVNLKLKAPQESGQYIVKLTLVQEGVCWFEERGFQMQTLDLTVA